MELMRKKRELCRLQAVPALPKFLVCNRLQPYVAQFGLTFTENEICFPQPLCGQQRAMYVYAYCEDLYEKSILFSDIVRIINHIGGIGLMLRTGHVFYFFSDQPLWYIHNALDFGKPDLIIVWWWMFSGKIIHWWRKQFHEIKNINIGRRK